MKKLDERLKPEGLLIEVTSDNINKQIDSDPLLQLQLAMATSAINHEYARVEFDDTICYERRIELIEFMADCQNKYTEARDSLCAKNPNLLETFEQDLRFQKQTALKGYNA